jgi:hypothetical protein
MHINRNCNVIFNDIIYIFELILHRDAWREVQAIVN